MWALCNAKERISAFIFTSVHILLLPLHKKARADRPRLFKHSGEPSYAMRLRRNSKADIPSASNAIEVGSGTTEVPAFQGVVAGKSGVVPETKAPISTSWLQVIRALYPIMDVPAASENNIT